MNPPNTLTTNTTRVARIVALILAAATSFTIGFFLSRTLPQPPHPFTPTPSLTPYSLLPTPVSEATPTPSSLSIAPGARAELTVPPDLDPTVECPTVHLIITVADEQTRQPVVAAISVDHHTTHGTGAEITVAANVPHTITVTAENYLPWKTRLETNLHHHKTMDLPILLHPAPDTG